MHDDKMGFLNIYKEKGMTSHDVVYQVRKILGMKKVGHAGTLDPNAEGVLLIGFGRGTKYIQYLELMDKIYQAQIIFGKQTDTYDITGKVTDEQAVWELSPSAFFECIRSFNGEIDQKPPIYSAIKKDGRRLYDYARKGEHVEIKSRKVKVHDIQVTNLSDFPREAWFKVHCSKGTYIRSLCHDIGIAMDNMACMGELTRLAIGPFDLDSAYHLHTLKELAQAQALDKAIIPIDVALGGYGTVKSTPQGERFIKNGNLLYHWNAEDDYSQYEDGQILRIYDGQAFIGLGQFVVDEDPFVKPIKLL